MLHVREEIGFVQHLGLGLGFGRPEFVSLFCHILPQ